MKTRAKRPARAQSEAWMGTQPAKAPLANPYVPFQDPKPPRYEARRGLIRGTLYPGLDLPFLGMVNEKEKPDTLLAQLQALGFAVQELALYLDTHREDTEALELYRSYQELKVKLREQYERECGPLSHMHPQTGPYRWLDDPWPWEYCANREG